MHSLTHRPCAPEGGAPPPVRLVLFAARRTGSSLLVNLLREHPRVLMHGELFHVLDLSDPDDGYVGKGPAPPENIFGVRRAQPLQMLRFVACHGEGRAVVGLKIFRDHLRVTGWPRVTRWCDVCVVLQREDLRAQYNSLLTARRTGQWKGKTSAAAAATQPQPANASSSGIGVGSTNFELWSGNQAHWFQAVTQQLAGRRGNVSVVHLTFERNLVGPRGPDLAPLWRALRLAPPRESTR